MSRNFSSRVRKLERITKPKPAGIHTYEGWLDAELSGDAIDYNSTAYLRRVKKLLIDPMRKEHERVAKTGQN